MHRRISLAIEFRKPDRMMQEEVWKTFQPPKVALEDDIDFGLIAKKYELPGGLIKNAWIQSLGLMAIRGRDKISQDDLIQAAGEQVIGQLTLEDFDRQVVTTCGLESMILAPAIKESLSGISKQYRSINQGSGSVVWSMGIRKDSSFYYWYEHYIHRFVGNWKVNGSRGCVRFWL
jgi:hypothetical protein